MAHPICYFFSIKASLVEKFPLLKELSIRINRPRGDAQEVSIHERIGLLLHLGYPDIELDASHPDHSFTVSHDPKITASLMF